MLEHGDFIFRGSGLKYWPTSVAPLNYSEPCLLRGAPKAITSARVYYHVGQEFENENGYSQFPRMLGVMLLTDAVAPSPTYRKPCMSRRFPLSFVHIDVHECVKGGCRFCNRFAHLTISFLKPMESPIRFESRVRTESSLSDENRDSVRLLETPPESVFFHSKVGSYPLSP